MIWESLSENLIGQFLIATPSLNDPHFSKTVTLICEHNESGSLGLIVNRPLDNDLEDLLKELNIPTLKDLDSTPILQGGPVGTERGFVIHNKGSWKHTSRINDWINITTSKDILESISSGNGPNNCLLVLGYSGWGPGQLETELAGKPPFVKSSSWLVANDTTPEQLFNQDPNDLWEYSVKTAGRQSVDAWLA